MPMFQYTPQSPNKRLIDPDYGNCKVHQWGKHWNPKFKKNVNKIQQNDAYLKHYGQLV